MGNETTQRVLEIRVNNEKAIAGIVKYNEEIEKQKQLQKQLKDAVKEGTISQQEASSQIAASKAEVKSHSDMVRTLEKEVQNNIKAQKSQEGSLEGLRAKLSNVTKEYDSMGKAARDGAKGKDKLKEINDITTELKAAEEESQRFYRNVGNYPDAVKPLKSQLKELTMVLAQMKLEGKDNTQEFQNMMKQAGELNDTIGDTKAQINAFASDTQKLDSARQGIETLTQSYMMWQMASKELGLENRELDELMRTIMASMAILNALTMVANALQKESALMKGITAVKTWALNTATVTQTAATAASAVATGTATSAQIAFNAAVAANPITWLVALVVGAIAAIYGLVKAVQWFCSSSTAMKETLKKEGELLERNIGINQRALEIMKAKGMSDQQVLNETMKIRRKELSEQEAHFKKAGQLYDEDSDEYKAAQEGKMKATVAFREVLNEGLNSLYKLQMQSKDKSLVNSMTELEYATYKANLEMKAQFKTLFLLKNAGRLTAESYSQLSAAIKDTYNDSIKDAKNAEAEKNKQLASAAAGAGKDRLSALKEAKDKEREAIRQANDTLYSLIKDDADRQRTETNAKYDREIEDLKRKLAEEKNLTTKAREAINETIKNLEKKRVQDLAKLSEDALNEKIAAKQKEIELMLAATKEGTAKEFQLKLQALAEQREAELNNAKLTAEQRVLINQKYNAAEDKLSDEHNDNVLNKQVKALEERLQVQMNETLLDKEELHRMEGESDYSWQERQREQQMVVLDEANNIAIEKRNNLHQLSTESDDEFHLRVQQADMEVAQTSNAIKEQETNYNIEQTQRERDARQMLTGSAIEMMEELGKRNKGFAIAAKTIALAEIAINTGKAIAAGTASAMSMPFPASLVAVATTVATVIANVTSAIKTVNSAKFASGGLVQGAGTGKSDSIPAQLSHGESVLTASATSMFSPILSSLNVLGGGVPIAAKQSSATIMGEDMLARAVAKGVSMMPAPIVSVKEISDVSNRVSIVERLGDI